MRVLFRWPRAALLAFSMCALVGGPARAQTGGSESKSKTRKPAKKPAKQQGKKSGAKSGKKSGKKSGAAKTGVKTAVFFVPAAGGLSRTTQATLLVTLENALGDNADVELVDIEMQLATRAGKVPSDRLVEARTRLSGAEGALNPDMADAAAAEFEDVLSELRDAVTYLEPAELAHAQFALGAAHAIAGDKKRAVTAFRRLASWNPDYVSSAKYAKGAVDAAWRTAKRAVAGERRGSLSLTSDPAGALAYVDGRFVGFTPLVVKDLSQGAHYVTFRLPGHYRVTQVASVRGRKARKVKTILQPAARAKEVTGLARAVGAAIDTAGDSPDAVDAKGLAALTELRDILGVREVIVVRVPDRASARPVYVGARFDADTRRQLSTVKAPAAEDTQTLLEDLARSLYTEIVVEKTQPRGRKKKPRGEKRFYQRWWFWTGVTTVIAAGVGVPLLFRYDVIGADQRACPIGSTCGQVIWQF